MAKATSREDVKLLFLVIYFVFKKMSSSHLDFERLNDLWLQVYNYCNAKIRTNKHNYIGSMGHRWRREPEGRGREDKKRERMRENKRKKSRPFFISKRRFLSLRPHLCNKRISWQKKKNVLIFHTTHSYVF